VLLLFLYAIFNLIGIILEGNIMRKARLLKKLLCFGITIGNLASSPALANGPVRAEYLCTDIIKDITTTYNASSLYKKRGETSGHQLKLRFSHFQDS